MATKPPAKPPVNTLMDRLGAGLRNLFQPKRPNTPSTPKPPQATPVAAPKPSRTGAATEKGPGMNLNPNDQPHLPPSGFNGSIDAQGNVTPPNVGGLMNTKLPKLNEAQNGEIKNANAALTGTEGNVAQREQRMEGDITSGIKSADYAVGQIQGIAGQGKAADAALPGQVKSDIEGITNEYKASTDVDIGKIESLGREAVGMAMQGKNAAAQATVEAQQASTRAAEAQINADPNIPPSRKTAMIAQIRTQSSMQIASTVGANIKDFTALQVGAMTQTMQSVGSAMTARNSVLGQLGGAEISAVASAHETAAGLMKGYDDMQASAIQAGEQLRFQYNNLRQVSRQTNNATDLELLGDRFYVGGMPVDFKLTDLQLTRDMMGTDFSMQLQARGFETMQQAVAAGDSWAKQTSMFQMLSQFLPGPLSMLGSMVLPAVMPAGQASPLGGAK